MTLSGIGKSVTLTDCHCKHRFSANDKGFLKRHGRAASGAERVVPRESRERERERKRGREIYGFLARPCLIYFILYYQYSSSKPPPQWPHAFFALMYPFAWEEDGISHQCNQLDDERKDWGATAVSLIQFNKSDSKDLVKGAWRDRGRSVDL